MHCGRPVVADTVEYCYDCSRNKSLTRSFTQGKSVFLYKGEMKKSLYRFKYAARREYADFYAKEALSKHARWIERIAPEVIIPIPMYAKKERKRGYNQAETFAKALSKRTGIVTQNNLVKRVKNTVPQKYLSDAERKNNLKNAFQTTENIVKYKKVLLVDDIYTTGSTAEAVTECLKAAGVKDVYFMSICIGKGN